VRDAALGVPSKDVDIEVFGLPVADLERLLKKLGRVNAVGRSFGVLKWRPRGHWGLGELDVSIPRRDSNVGPGHRGIAVEGDPTMTVEEAVHRRDLTINAILFDIVSSTVVDPSGGLDDLADGRLRAVDAGTFLEDPLRALRVVQFAARLGFAPDDELLALCRDASLDELPAERIQGEWGKLLLKGRHIAMAMELAAETQVLPRILPRWPTADAGPVLDGLVPHRARILGRDESKAEGRAWALMLTGWLAGATSEVVEDVLDRLWLHKVSGYPVRTRVQAAVLHLEHPLATDADLRRLATVAEVETVASVRDARGHADGASALDRGEALGVLHAKPAPLLQGRSLKGLMRPGPAMGEVLAAVYDAQLEGTVTTPDEALAMARTRIPS